ncbi:MAG: DMT family transporter [Pseudomonadales bacterium]|nr:DMT family transporter [Pseudomonadales bacterium]
MGALIRDVSDTVNNESIVFFRNATGLLILIPWLLRKGPKVIATDVFRFHLLRTASGLTAMYCFFHLIANIPLAEAMLFNYSAPVFIPLIAYLWLKEPLTRERYFAIAVGFSGVLLIIKPGTDMLNIYSVTGLVAGSFAALAFVTVQKLSRSESAYTIVFYFSAFSTLISAIPFSFASQALNTIQILSLIGIGTLATLSQFCLTRAYGLAPAAQIGPAQYLSIIFAGFFGWLFWQELPDYWALAGAILIFLSSLMATGKILPTTIRPKNTAE